MKAYRRIICWMESEAKIARENAQAIENLRGAGWEIMDASRLVRQLRRAGHDPLEVTEALARYRLLNEELLDE